MTLPLSGYSCGEGIALHQPRIQYREHTGLTSGCGSVGVFSIVIRKQMRFNRFAGCAGGGIGLGEEKGAW